MFHRENGVQHSALFSMMITCTSKKCGFETRACLRAEKLELTLCGQKTWAEHEHVSSFRAFQGQFGGELEGSQSKI